MTSPYQDAVLTDAPYAAWTLEGTDPDALADYSGHGAGLLFPDGAGPTRSDSGLTFGPNQRLQTTAHMDAPTAQSVEFWITTTADQGVILSSRSGDTGLACFMGRHPVGFMEPGQLMFGVSGADRWAGAYTTEKINDGKEHHVVLTWKGVPGQPIALAQFQIFIDGAPGTLSWFTYRAASAPLGSGAYWFNAGGPYEDNAAGWLNATVRRISFYRTALTPARVLAHYESATYVPPPAAGVWTSQLATALELDPATVQPVVELRTYAGGTWSTELALSLALAGYSVTYGRRSGVGPADALVCVLELATARLTTTPQIADRIRLQLADLVATALELEPGDAIRFTGEVTDVEVDHGAHLTRVTCVGRLARAGRVQVDPTLWPVELDAERIARVLAAAPLGLTPGTIDAGGVPLATPDRPDTVRTLLAQVTESTGGQLLENLTGAVDYHDAEHRRGRVPALTLAAADVFRAITWTQRVGDVVNDVTVEYVDPEPVEVRVTDPVSADPLDGLGPYPATVKTLLTNPDDAYALGALLVGRSARPAWQLPDLTVDLIRTLDLVQLRRALELRHGERVALTGFPAGCPIPGVVIVEGWTETATPSSWRMSITATDPLLAGVSLRWMDVTPTLRWSDVDPTTTWLDVARMESPTDLT